MKELVSEKESIKSPEEISGVLGSFFVNMGQKMKDKLSNAKSKRKLLTVATLPKLKRHWRKCKKFHLLHVMK